MATAIIMPKAGMAMEEGTIVKWLKAEGEQVSQGEALLEILTDKVNMEVEAQVSGTLIRILKKEGDVVPVTRTIGYLGEPGEVPAEEDQSAGEKKPEEKNRPAAGTEPEKAMAKEGPSGVPTEGSAGKKDGYGNRLEPAAGKIAATPAARRIAAEKQIDLSRIRATGQFGEIRARDVLEQKGASVSPLARRVAEANGIDPQTVAGSGYNGKVLLQDVASAMSFREVSSGETGLSAEAAGTLTPDGKEILEVIPYSGIRKVIGERMAQSKFTAPHLYFTQKINVEKLLELRKQINAAQEKKTSVTDYIAKAAINAIRKYPDFNVSLIEDKIVKYRSINLGIAVAAPGGLIVPVIKNANDKSVVELSNDAGALFEKARSGKLKPDEYTGGTFTISNLGMFGIENFTAIINPPEVAILAVSATKDEPVVVTDAMGGKTVDIKPMMNLTLTVDHRLVDGLLAAQFVAELKRLLENPIELLI